jgi:hypothetical protein
VTLNEKAAEAIHSISATLPRNASWVAEFGREPYPAGDQLQGIAQPGIIARVGGCELSQQHGSLTAALVPAPMCCIQVYGASSSRLWVSPRGCLDGRAEAIGQISAASGGTPMAGPAVEAAVELGGGAGGRVASQRAGSVQLRLLMVIVPPAGADPDHRGGLRNDPSAHATPAPRARS